MAHDEALYLDRRDPFAAGLYEILRAIYELYNPVLINNSDITCAEPAFGKLGGGFGVFILGTSNPGAAYLQLTEGLVVPGDLLAGVDVHDAELDTW